MKKFILASIALICAAALCISCNKDNGEEETVNIQGDWKYIGCDSTCTDDLDFTKFYLFRIDESKIHVYEIDKTTLSVEYSYTRKGNRISFSPAFNGKYGSANICNIFGQGVESISWDCGNGQVYNFSRTN